MQNGVKQGRWISYYKSGLKSKSQYLQKGIIGGPDYVFTGKEYSWFPTGTLKEEYNWVKGKLDGVQKLFYASGVLKKELTSVKGFYYSEVRDYYYSDDGENVLKSVFFFEWDHTLREENLLAEIPTNLIQAYEDNQLFYPALQKSSWKHYYLSGALKAEGYYEKGNYKTGTKERFSEHMYEDTREKKILKEIVKENDSKYAFTGEENLYYPDSLLRETRHWLNGKIEGLIKQYYHSGKLKKEIPCVNGLFHGLVKEYYESGQLYSEMYCANGKDTSAKKIYYTNGILRQEGPLKDGCYRRYDSLGNKLSSPKAYNNNMDDKPVIYLYPPKPKTVEVKLDYHGKFSITYPEYKNGWKVKAFPDGRLINEADRQEYSYLFWEGKNYGDYLNKLDLTKGTFISGAETEVFLRNTLAEIGLLPKEYNEFIVYWLPKMRYNSYNYIHFITGKDYDQIAGIDVKPLPDAMLRVFMVYQPMDYKMNLEPQKFEAFKRKGFTVVEWGGSETKELFPEF